MANSESGRMWTSDSRFCLIVRISSYVAFTRMHMDRGSSFHLTTLGMKRA